MGARDRHCLSSGDELYIKKKKNPSLICIFREVSDDLLLKGLSGPALTWVR